MAQVRWLKAKAVVCSTNYGGLTPLLTKPQGVTRRVANSKMQGSSCWGFSPPKAGKSRGKPVGLGF